MLPLLAQEGEQQVVAVLIVDAVGDHQGADEGHQQQQPEAPEPRHGQRVASVGGPGLLQGERILSSG